MPFRHHSLPKRERQLEAQFNFSDAYPAAGRPFFGDGALHKSSA
jgi:hypothetical protein